MAKLTQREQLIAGLTKMGYQRAQTTSRRYVSFARGDGQFFYVGKSGALRMGHSISTSFPLSEKQRETIIKAGQGGPTLSWNTTITEALLIRRIARRAVEVAETMVMSVPLSRGSVEMDITVAHCNGCPLRLADLLAADRFNFIHDVFGIRAHLDRKTGQLVDFHPRFHATLEEPVA